MGEVGEIKNCFHGRKDRKNKIPGGERSLIFPGKYYYPKRGINGVSEAKRRGNHQ